jgi:hypothetical protein
MLRCSWCLLAAGWLQRFAMVRLLPSRYVFLPPILFVLWSSSPLCSAYIVKKDVH